MKPSAGWSKICLVDVCIHSHALENCTPPEALVQYFLRHSTELTFRKDFVAASCVKSDRKITMTGPFY